MQPDHSTSELESEEYLPIGLLVDDRYRIEGVLGKGGFAIVYKAFHTRLDKMVALKVLDMSGNSRDMRTFRERFEREARLASRLDLPNVVSIYDFGFIEQTQQPYIAMEMLDGHDLEVELDRNGPMHVERVARHFIDVLHALDLGHQKGVVHKDLKPSNLFLVQPNTPHERVVVLDYGIARVFDDPDAKLTATNQFSGTPAYMAPEYIERQEVSPRIDVYQMGLIFIELLTGRSAIKAESAMAFFLAHCTAQHNIPATLVQTPLGQVLLRAIHVDPHQRFQSAQEFRHALMHVPLVQGDWVQSANGQGTHSPTADAAVGFHASTQPEHQAHQSGSHQQSGHTASLEMSQPFGATRPQGGSNVKVVAAVAMVVMVLCLVLGAVVLSMLFNKATTDDTLPTIASSSIGGDPSNVAAPHKDLNSQYDNAMRAAYRGVSGKLKMSHTAVSVIEPAVAAYAAIYVRGAERSRKKAGQSTQQKFKMLESSAPTGPIDNFTYGQSYIKQAISLEPKMEALDAALRDYNDQLTKMEQLFMSMHEYFHEFEDDAQRERRQKDAAGLKAIDDKFWKTWSAYSKVQKRMRRAFIEQDIARLNQLVTSFEKEQNPLFAMVSKAHLALAHVIEHAEAGKPIAKDVAAFSDALKRARKLGKTVKFKGQVWQHPRHLISGLDNVLHGLKKLDKASKDPKGAVYMAEYRSLQTEYTRSMMTFYDFTKK